MNTDGTGRIKLTFYANTGELDGHYYPVWSPDSSKIMYNYLCGTKTGIYTINCGGTDTIRLTDENLEGNATYSPDGTKIAIVALTDTDHDEELNSNIGKDTYQLWVMDADGTNRVQLTDIPTRMTNVSVPLWFPDSEHILASYSAKIDGEDPEGALIVNIETKGTTILRGIAGGQDISSDGMMLVSSGYEGDKADTSYLYIVTLEVGATSSTFRSE